MHRATPLNTSIRSYTAGGSRSVVDQVDDSKFMQEMAGNFMANESRKGVEAPQNYGFTSVVFDAEKGEDGKIAASAETFVSFMGGNRSFPVGGNMDDRRHRLYKLEKGDTAMFRGRGDMQQFHLSQDGGFWTAPQDKTVRMQLLTKNSTSNASIQKSGSGSSGSSGAQARDAGSSGGGSSGSSGQPQHGQEAVYKDGQNNHQCVEINKDKTRCAGTTVHLGLADGNTYLHVNSDKNVYVGGQSGQGQFAMLVTVNGPCTNSQGKMG